MGRLGLVMSGPRKHKTHRLEKYLENNSGKKVTSMHIGRTPISSAIETALNTLSFGKYGAMKKTLGYPDTYHSFVIAGLDDGTFHKLERNHVIEAKPATNEDLAVDELLDVPMVDEHGSRVDIDLDEMIDNAANNDPNFYVYRAGSRNCQFFVKDVVKNNKLIPRAFVHLEGDQGDLDPVSEEILKARTFLEPQNSEALLSTIPGPLSGVVNAITDAGASLDRGTSLVANGFPQYRLKSKKPGKGKINKRH
jgi:hypothetical protein